MGGHWNVKILGADKSVTNLDPVGAVNYLPQLQVSTGQRSKLFKATISNLGATDLYLWIFDVAAGSTASVAPVAVELCPAGVCTTLDFANGTPFVNGIYFSLSTANAVNGSSTVTAAANNAAIVKADFRLE